MDVVIHTVSSSVGYYLMLSQSLHVRTGVLTCKDWERIQIEEGLCMVRRGYGTGFFGG